MLTYQKTFIELALAHEALRFGEFKLKSGRLSPYFFNVGQLNSGAALATLGECYAGAITHHQPQFDVLFGPAYKGIPLVCTTTIALYAHHQRNIPYAFNRKEVKDHGEGGLIVGSSFAQQRVLLIDDVITAGTALRQAFEIVQKEQGEVAGVVIALDRQEKGQGQPSAVQELEAQYGIRAHAIIRFEDILTFVKQDPRFENYYASLTQYRETYGIA